MEIIFEYSLSIIWSFFELVTLLLFSSAFMPRRTGIKVQVLSFCIIWSISSLLACLEINATIRQITTLCMAFLWTLILFRGSWLKHVLFVIMSYIFTCVVDICVCYGISALLKLSFNDLVQKKLLYTIVATTAKLIELLLSYYVQRVRRSSQSYPVRSQWLFLMILFPLVSLIMLVIIFENNQDSQDLSIGAFIISCILAVSNIAIMYLIRAMEKATQRETELILLNSQMDIQTKSILALEKSYRAQREAVHEFQHHLQTIKNLLSSNEIDTLHAYLTHLQQTQTTRIFCVNSKHPIVDAVLNQKYQIAKECNIDIQIQVNDLSAVSIPNDAIVVVLSNLLDNAIEACQMISGNRVIQCRLIAQETLLVSIRNTSNPVLIAEDYIPTTKEPKEEHGYGLINVRNIMSQLRAEYAFRYSDGWFQFGAEIPLNK